MFIVRKKFIFYRRCVLDMMEKFLEVGGESFVEFLNGFDFIIFFVRVFVVIVIVFD